MAYSFSGLAVLLSVGAFAQSSDYEIGVALIQKGQMDAAASVLARASESQPRDPRIWKALGVAYAAQKMYPLAEPAFQRACELAPRLEDACYYHARALYALDRYEDALAALNRILAVEPKGWRIPLAIAQALEALGRAPDAEKQFQLASSTCQGKDAQPGVAYGLFLIRQGRLPEAIAPLEAVLKRFPESAEGHVYLGRALLEQGSATAAIPHFEQALAINSQSTQAHLLLAKAYLQVGRSAEAKPHLEAAKKYE